MPFLDETSIINFISQKYDCGGVTCDVFENKELESTKMEFIESTYAKNTD